MKTNVPVKVFALQHRTCGHLAGAMKTRPQAQHALDHLTAAGYHQWRIRVVDVDTAAEQLVAGTRCTTCAIDPARGLLLADARGQCRVCHPTTTTPEPQP